VQPDAEAAKAAVETWKRIWWHATFGGEEGTGGKRDVPDEDHIRSILGRFGDEFVALARSIWEIQADALSKADFVE
jgi:hypothetical protein